MHTTPSQLGAWTFVKLIMHDPCAITLDPSPCLVFWTELCYNPQLKCVWDVPMSYCVRAVSELLSWRQLIGWDESAEVALT